MSDSTRRTAVSVECPWRNPDCNDGREGLSTNHFKNASGELFIYTACMLSVIMVHGSVPEDLLQSTAIPIPKGRNTNVTDSGNYRGISLSSIFGKIFDIVILSRYSETSGIL